MVRAVSIVLGLLLAMLAAAVVYGVERRAATTFWMQRAAACWADSTHPLPPGVR